MTDGMARKDKHWLDRVLLVIAYSAVLTMTILTTVSVIGRYAFGTPVSDIFVINEMLLVAVVLMPLAWCQAEKANIEVTVFTDDMPLSWLWCVRIFGTIIAIVSFGALSWAMIIGAFKAWTVNELYFGINPIPTWPSRAAGAVGLIGFVIRMIRDLWALIRDGPPNPDHA